MSVCVMNDTGSQFIIEPQQQKIVDLLLLCEQSTDHQMALLSVAVETGNPFLPVAAASYQV